MFADNVERVAEWLLSGEGDVFAAGGGLEAVKSSELDDERLAIARELATICGKPPRLCWQALAMFQVSIFACMDVSGLAWVGFDVVACVWACWVCWGMRTFLLSGFCPTIWVCRTIGTPVSTG
jgi:hypothetical protein